jgi:hypothetical protein
MSFAYRFSLSEWNALSTMCFQLSKYLIWVWAHRWEDDENYESIWLAIIAATMTKTLQLWRVKKVDDTGMPQNPNAP